MPDPLQNPGPSPIPFAVPNTDQIPSQVVTSNSTPVQGQSNPPDTSALAQQQPQMPPKNNKKMLFIGLGLIILLLLISAGIFYILPKLSKKDSQVPTPAQDQQKITKPLPTPVMQNSPSPATASAQTSDPSFTSTDGLFTISGPTGWLKSTSNPTALVFFQNPSADTNSSGQTLGAFINVSADVTTPEMSLDNYAKLANTQRNQTLIGYKLISESKGSLSGNPANIDLYSAKIGSIDVKQGQIYTIKNQKAYVITFSAIGEAWDKYTDTFNNSAKSFKFVAK